MLLFKKTLIFFPITATWIQRTVSCWIYTVESSKALPARQPSGRKNYSKKITYQGMRSVVCHVCSESRWSRLVFYFSIPLRISIVFIPFFSDCTSLGQIVYLAALSDWATYCRLGQYVKGGSPHEKCLKVQNPAFGVIKVLNFLFHMLFISSKLNAWFQSYDDLNIGT